MAATSIAPARPRRGSASPIVGLRAHLWGHRGAPRDLSRSRPTAMRVRARRRRTRSPPPVPIFSTAMARSSPPTQDALAVRRAAADHRSSTRRVELLTAVMPDLDAAELRDRLGVQAGLRVAQARDHAASSSGSSSARYPRHRFSDREQARLSRTARSLARDRPCQYRQSGHRRHREMARRAWARRPASCGLRHRPRSRQPIQLAVDLRVQHACATNSWRRATNSKPRRRRPRARRAHRRNRRRWSRSPTTILTIRARRSIPPASTASPTASMKWDRRSRR